MPVCDNRYVCRGQKFQVEIPDEETTMRPAQAIVFNGRLGCRAGPKKLAILNAMRTLRFAIALALPGLTAFAQPAPTATSFEVVSVRPSPHAVGPDYNNQIAYTPTGFTARNVTLKRLIAEAWHLQTSQVIGPNWLDQNEYEIEARVPEGPGPEDVHLMLERLLADRFGLKVHSESRPMRAYALVVAPGRPQNHPDDPGAAVASHPGSHFRGDMRQFADFLTVQFSIPSSSLIPASRR